MNWKEYAYLFTNGNFKLKTDKGSIVNLTGINNGVLIVKNRTTANEIADDCALIARKIEDMTDEEMSKALSYVNLDPMYDKIREIYENPYDFIVTHLTGRTDVFLYLLSIGVCIPHFWDETVIDIKTLTEEHK